jgi:hypothetical protein
MTKLHLITGNHKFMAGIADIQHVLFDVVGHELSHGTFAETSKINFVIEDFASREFTEYILNSKFRICLVLTEFMNLGYYGKVSLNKFGLKSNRIYLLFEDVLISFLRYFKLFLPVRFRSKAEKLIYWKNREVGLRRILKSDRVVGIFCLHPEIEVQSRLYLPFFPKDSFFTLFPRLSGLPESTDILNVPIVSFGSKNRYRKKQIIKFNKVFPTKVIEPNFEKESVSRISDIPRPFVDLYFKNSKNWKYLSPIRFWRTLHKGSFVVYFGKELTDHPINKCAIRAENYEDFARSLEDLAVKKEVILNEINVYDEFAKETNDRSLTFLQGLIQNSNY